MNIKKWIYLQKEGIGAGTLIALLLYYFNWNLPINLHVTGIAKLIVMIIIFGGIGALIDSIYKPNQ